MCGIVGIIARPGAFQEEDLKRAVASLRHRGPDGAGVTCALRTTHWECWLGHSRLSIIDLSDAGRQPMRATTRDGREGVLVYNGETYNHQRLRSRLNGWSFRSTSDTEVLLAGLLSEGSDFLQHTLGMLACAFVDVQSGSLLLARDRLGKKPLFVYRGADVLAFASELKAFVELGLPLTIDSTALAHFRWLGHVPGEMTIYRECRKLPAASWIRYVLDGPVLEASPPVLYWDPLAGSGQRFEGGFDDAVDAFLELLDDAVALRLAADVPIGVFLSGGIDSSLVASSVARQHRDEVTAFIIKADDPSYDESAVAMQTAAHLGLRTHVEFLRREDYGRQVALVPHHYDEPCSTLSQIPTLAIAEVAAQHVKVVLTGDGGDEVFLGYPWLGHPERLFRYRRPLDFVPGMRRLVGHILPTPLGRGALWAAVRALGLNTENIETKLLIAQDLLAAEHPADLYEDFQGVRPRRALSAEDRQLIGPEALLARARRWYPAYGWESLAQRSIAEQLGALEMVTWMRDEILVKVDRATMAYSLEARSPFLDHRLIEFGQSLPLSYKSWGDEQKRVLRAAAARRVGECVARRRKTGFGVPAPENLPPGMSTSSRWNEAVETGWREHWRTGMQRDRMRLP